MSGKKYSYVSTTSYQRSTINAYTQPVITQAERDRQRIAALETANRDAQSRISSLNSALQRTVNSANEEIRRLSEEQNRRLRAQAADFKADIDALRRQREADRAELAAAIDSINRRLEEKERSHRAIAEYWISNAKAFFQDIAGFRHELFAPSQLSHLQSLLSQVAEDMRAQAYQSAIAHARSVFNQAVELKERIVNAEIEWAHFHSEFRNVLADVESTINYYRSLKYQLPGGAGEVAADVDYWTDGELSEIIARVADIKERTNDIETVSTSELMDYIASLKDILKAIESAGEKAKEALICSQIRAEIANSIAGVLQESGWEYVGATYEGSEMNAALHIKLRDNMGNEVVTVLSPERDKEGNLGNNMEFNFFSDFNNDDRARGIAVDAIVEQLRGAGLDVPAPKTRAGYENRSSDNEALRNIEQTARRKAK